ncbi:MAG: Fic family protein [Chitinophagaceae bacterium]|nr:Fic family protein [Chitinophagaceae bacterium]
MVQDISIRNKFIIDFIMQNPECSSKKIHESMSQEVSYATLKRALSELQKNQLISTLGTGKSTKYIISKSYHVLYPINSDKYFSLEIDERKINSTFNFKLLQETLYGINLFTDDELAFLESLQKKFTQNIKALNKNEYSKELERLAIDLSWKSSQIEGNTYSLLETERLLKDKETTTGKTKDEATMILNHKAALDFIIEHPEIIEPLKSSTIENIHSILIQELNIKKNIRNSRVGISGTNYKPLDNQFQIKEALNDLCNLVNKRNNVFEKAFLVLLLISYIQPFADGNKRTARIISNAILIYNKHCPISFRTVDSIEYKKTMLIFYEQSNISAFKNIFINQFEFAVNTYF